MQARVTIEVYTPAGGWQPFTPTSPPIPPLPGWENIIGVRATIAELLPTETFDLRIGCAARGRRTRRRPADLQLLLRDGADSQDDPYVSQNYCNPPLHRSRSARRGAQQVDHPRDDAAGRSPAWCPTRPPCS